MSSKLNRNEIKRFSRQVILKNVGIILFKNSDALEALLRSQAEIFLKIPVNDEVNLLSDKQCMELINWDAEKFRKKMIQ